MKRSTKRAAGSTEATSYSFEQHAYPPPGKRSLHQPNSIVRILIVGVFGFILLSVGTLHMHLINMDARYYQNSNAQKPSIGVSNVLRNRLINKSMQQVRDAQNQMSESRFPSRSLNHAEISSSNNQIIPGRGIGSKRGHVNCEEKVDLLVSYWNDPRSDQDRTFESPFIRAPVTHHNDLKASNVTRYLSFEPDSGGWNNIRMEFEIMVVLAAATGRTLILPPDYPVYLLHKDKKSRHRGLQDFFQYNGNSNSSSSGGGGGFDDIVNVIMMQDFFHESILDRKLYPLPSDDENRTKVLSSIQKCNYKAKDSKSCVHLFDHMSRIADLVPNWNGEQHCLIMDDANWYKDSLEMMTQSAAQRQKVLEFCNDRSPVYYSRNIHDAPLIHFRSHLKATRLLVHFYAFIHFTNPVIGNYFKRLVRDRVRYSDAIQCAAGKVVKSLLEDFGSYSSMHIRRGDFQWPKMRISAEEWLKNTQHIFLENEVVYICTDETNMTFFEPLRSRYRLKFLSDYKELAKLDSLDPNFVGMIDVVIASRGENHYHSFAYVPQSLLVLTKK
eukprot:scaffold26575_cov72-Cyclotella_meneghiniana.AAC.7